MLGYHVAQIKRLAGRMLFVLVTGLCSSCGTYVAYSGPQIPDAEVATVECYTRFYVLAGMDCYFHAVDGTRPDWPIQPQTLKLTPGPHFIETVSEVFMGYAAGGEVCAFDLDVAAGHSYMVKSFQKTGTSKFGQMMYAGTVEIEAKSLAGDTEVQTKVTTCVNGRTGGLCRQTSDCVAHPSIQCVAKAGYPVGICESVKE